MGDVAKAVEKTVKTVKKATGIDKVEKVVKDIPLVGDAVKGVEKTVHNVGKEADRVYKRNKSGLDAAAGLAARGTAAFYTFGASELVGGGDYLTKQFAGSEGTRALAPLVGGLAGGAGAARGISALANAGKISSTVANVGGKVAGSVISQRAAGQSVDVGRTIASVATSSVGGGDQNNNSGGNMNFWEEQWNNYGGQVVGSVLDSILGGSRGGDAPASVAPPPQQSPVIIQGGNGGDNEKMMMLMAGGLGLVTLLVLLKK